MKGAISERRRQKCHAIQIFPNFLFLHVSLLLCPKYVCYRNLWPETS